MRIVIKPAGAALILLAIGTLVFLLARKNAHTSAPASGSVSTQTRTPASGGASSQNSAARPRPHNAAQAIIDPLTKKWALTAKAPAKATLTDLTADDLPAGTNPHIAHLTVTAVNPSDYSSVQIAQQAPRPIASGHQMEVRFWGRAPKGTGSVYVVFEEGGASHTAELSKMVPLAPQWQEYTLPFVTTKDHTTTSANIAIKAGTAPGEIDIADVRIADYGK